MTDKLLYSEDGVAAKLEEARKLVAEGRASEARVAEIHARFTYRMHDCGARGICGWESGDFRE